MSRRRVAIAALALAAVAAASLVALEARRRAGHYWYDVRADHAYAFSGPWVERAVVDVTEDGFVVPGAAAAWDTAILELDVTTSLAGRWFEPSLEISLGDGRASRQALERGARGTRYVNVTHAAGRSPAEGDRVRLRGRHARWEPQSATLFFFRTPALDRARILVLAPHPDDAEIAAFGLYATHDAVVATLTPGNYADARLTHLVDSRAAADDLLADLRTWDALAAPLWGGVEPASVVSLGYRSRSLEPLRLAASHGEESSSTRADTEFVARHRRGNVAGLLGTRTPAAGWESLVADLAELLGRSAADVVVAPHPALDADTDHRATTFALLEALRRTGDTATTLLLYTNHHVLAESFPFGPADFVVTLPPWLDASLPFGGVHSAPLDADLQVRKLFAIDAMHDLREPPRPHLGGPAGRFARRAARALTDLVRDPVQSYSYLRRAPRPNELFFVVPPSERRRSLGELEDREAGRPAMNGYERSRAN